MSRLLTAALGIILSLQLGACVLEATDEPGDELGTSEIRKIRNGLLPDCFFALYGDYRDARNRALKDDYRLRSLQAKQLSNPLFGTVPCGEDLLEKMAMLALDPKQSLKVNGGHYPGGAGLDPSWPIRAIPTPRPGQTDLRQFIEQGMAATLNKFAYEVDICLSAPVGTLAQPDLTASKVCDVTQGAYMAIDQDGTTFMGVCTDPDLVKALGDENEAGQILDQVMGKSEALARIGRDYFIPCGSCDKVCSKKVNGAWANCTCPNRPMVASPITVSVSQASIDYYVNK